MLGRIYKEDFFKKVFSILLIILFIGSSSEPPIIASAKEINRGKESLDLLEDNPDATITNEKKEFTFQTGLHKTKIKNVEENL
ncbi:MAG TPA: hypothetical protein ENI51_04810, partial [Candidatus Atribacteria bacterium]|nr:hypothetical protein [Candidatus Atribacteria bacterium]